MVFAMRVLPAAIVLVLSGFPAMSMAQGLTGSTVAAVLAAPTADNVLAGPLVAVVGSGTEFGAGAFIPGRLFEIDVSENQVTYYTRETVSYGGGEFNGFGLTFTGAPTITSVTFNGGASTFSPTSFFWTGNTLYFNVADLSVTGADRITFDVNVSVSAVPEPASTALLVTGLAVVAPLALRRRRVNLGA